MFYLITFFYHLISDHNLDYVTKRSDQVLVMFRGIFLFILYQWLLGWNVYGWNKYNVNYKLIFKFNYHYSSLVDILKRASIFTFIYILSFSYYAEMLTLKQSKPLLNPDYCPFVIWVIYLGYIFFPSGSVLNGEGRWYFIKLLKSCLFSSFY